MRFIGVEQVVTIDGIKYRLSRFTIALLVRWLHWATSQLEPINTSNLHLLSLPALEHIEETASTWHSLNNPYVKRLFASPEGQEQVWRLLFDKYHWDIDAPCMPYNHQHILDRATGVSSINALDLQFIFLTELGLIQKRDNAATDWAEQFKSLFQNLNLPPHVISDMTLPELATVCQGKHDADTMTLLAMKYARETTLDQKKELAIRRINALLA